MKEVTLEEMLQARDERVFRQRQLQEKYPGTLIYLTMNIPGPVKVPAGVKAAFFEAVSRTGGILKKKAVPVTCHGYTIQNTGCEAWWTVEASPSQIKEYMTDMEESTPRGRLLDLDVLDENGCKISRKTPRRCLLCDRPAAVCARSREHSVEEMMRKIDSLVSELSQAEKEAQQTGLFAREALEEEVLLTPKPGLVDQHDSGAHSDMDLQSFLKSAEVLSPYIEDMYLQGFTWEGDTGELLSAIRLTGLLAEQAMYRVTDGVNTHKGAVFLLGILAASAGLVMRKKHEGKETCSITDYSRRMCEYTLQQELAQSAQHAQHTGQPAQQTHGIQMYERYGTTGIRGEAAKGFPTVQKARDLLHTSISSNRDQQLLYTLLCLMAETEDTNVLYRAGAEGLAYMHMQAGAVLSEWQKMCMKKQRQDFTCEYKTEQADIRLDAQRDTQLDAQGDTQLDLQVNTQLSEMNRQFVSKNISPGGCADLLSGAVFLDRLETYINQNKRSKKPLTIYRYRE